MLSALLGERETVMKAKETLLDEVCIRKSTDYIKELVKCVVSITG